MDFSDFLCLASVFYGIITAKRLLYPPYAPTPPERRDGQLYHSCFLHSWYNNRKAVYYTGFMPPTPPERRDGQLYHSCFALMV